MAHTSVLERRETFTGDFACHPCEVAWAGEAIFFIRIEEISPDTLVRLRAQISADGINWIDEGGALPSLGAPGNTFLRLEKFGGWLRLAGSVEGASIVLTVHLSLKE
jgi:hypothetical protein